MLYTYATKIVYLGYNIKMTPHTLHSQEEDAGYSPNLCQLIVKTSTRTLGGAPA